MSINATVAVLTQEPALLQNIVGFVPTSAALGDQPCTSNPRVVLETIAALCCAIPGLSQRVGPVNEMFWREMVLAQFDFTVAEDIFDVDDWGGGVGACSIDTTSSATYENDPCDDEQLAHWHRHPQNGPLREWALTHPGERYPKRILTEGLRFWPSLQAYFPATKYGFLGEVQQDKTHMTMLWPDDEDAFSLFCDLLLLGRFQSVEGEQLWAAHSDGDELLLPCLMGRCPASIVGRGFAMLTLCGIAPRFWFRNAQPVSARWSGLDGPPPSIKCKYPQNDNLNVDHYLCTNRTKEEDSVFPDCGLSEGHPFQELRRFVYETFTDWRRVQVNSGEIASPDFYIGKSKRSGRWLGLVGQSDYLYP